LLSDGGIAVYDGEQFGIRDGVERGAGAAAAGGVLGTEADELDLCGGVCVVDWIVFSDGAGGGIAVSESRGCADVCGIGILRGTHYFGWGIYGGAFGFGAERDSGGGVRVDGVAAGGGGVFDWLAAGAVCVELGADGGDCDMRSVCDGGGVHGAVVGAAIYDFGACGDFICAGAGVRGDYVVCVAA